MPADRQGCVFCAIVAGVAPATVTANSPAAIALVPLNPATDGHAIVIPRVHSVGILDTAPGVWAAVMELARAVVAELNSRLEPDGINIIQSTGAAATQTVPHLHVHVVPRYRGDRMGRIWPTKE